jgi:RecA/RadA recombinase
MVKKQNEEITESKEISIDDLFEKVDKLNPDGAYLDENALSIVNDWIDTGCYALNAIMSGSLYKGIPVGRITGLVGPSGVGKSLILAKICANAQKKGYTPVLWDSELAFDDIMASNLGCDTTNMKVYPTETIEDTRNQISAFLDKIIETKTKKKFIIGIDSLGNLQSSKERRDAEEGKEASDLGQRAKASRSMLRVITYKAAKAGIPIIFTNHIYESMELYPSLIKKQSGGQGPVYLASLLIQLGVRSEKQDDKNENDKMIPIANKVSGVTLRAMTVKNRFIPPFLETELYMNFKTGLYKYSGLLELALAYGIIVQSGPVYKKADGTSLGYLKDWKDNEEFWKTNIMPLLEEKINKEFVYSTLKPIN